MAHCLIALGSNLGDRAMQLQQATAELARLPATRLIARSRWRETAPIGGPRKQGPFLNAAVLISTSMVPAALHMELRRIELTLGRVRGERWGARSLDIDLLLYDVAVVQSAELTVPHPRMAYRRFVLEPAVEVAAWMVHPESGWTVGRLLDHLNHGSEVVAVAAADVGTAKAFASEIADRLSLPTPADNVSAPWRPRITRWDSEHEHGEAMATHPKLLLAVGSGGTDSHQMRKILNLPTTGPVAWLGPEASDAVDEAIAAIQSVWPALAT
jgi:2-amino-4-hydroxy-6-hydroxymethyldihydropteridine diphosphokinase